MIHHTFDVALAVARRIHATPDGQMQRAATGLSLRDVTSLAILVVQLDAIAQAAAAVPLTLDQAAFVMLPDEFALFADLQERLLAAGYLPLQNIPATKEHRRGES